MANISAGPPEDYKDEVKEWSANWGYTTVGFPQPPFAVDTLYDRDYPGNDWPKSELIDRLNNNPNIVNHIGHANPTYVMKINNADADGLTNSNYFFGWTQGCYAGSFDNRWSNCNYGSSDCILEHFVVADHGAFAFIGKANAESKEDNVGLILMQNPVGRTFVKIYYSTSPPIADLVRDNDGLRLIVREGLVKTSVYVARRFVD